MNIVKLRTTFGEISIELYSDTAPNTVENFLKYVKSGYYDNTLFHRVIDGFMVQGGGFTEDMIEKQSKLEPIQNEANSKLRNERGTIAMARTSDPHSATSQFFINVEDNAFLNHTSKTPQGYGYAVFGKVIAGMDVVDKIKISKTCSRAGHQDVPEIPVLIHSALIATEKNKTVELA